VPIARIDHSGRISFPSGYAVAQDGLVAASDRWQLRQGETVLGDVEITDADFPWLRGAWHPTNEFDSVRALFRAELGLIDDAGEEWERAYREIYDAGVRLYYPDGRKVPEFLLHVDDDVAWFRWNDEPFAEGGIGDEAEPIPVDPEDSASRAARTMALYVDEELQRERAKREQVGWDALAGRLTSSGLVRVTYLSHPTPVQFEGRLATGEAVYFRARHETAELYVADAGQPTDFTKWDRWIWHTEIGGWEPSAAGYIEPDETERVARELINRYTRGDPTDDLG